MSILYIRLPSHAVAEALPPGTPMYCEFAVATNNGALEREGVAALPDMGELVRKAQRVILLVAAGDVTLLRVKVPPLSPSRLRVALPNLVEDQLMTDPAECVVVADSGRGDTRTVAVVQRHWLEVLSRTMNGLGARTVSALPAQLCLPLQPDGTSAAVAESGADIDVAIRMSAHEGVGLSMVADAPESAAFDVIQSVAAVVREGAVALYVPQSRVRDYEESLHIAPALSERVTVHADNWQRWINGSGAAGLDLMTGLGGTSGRSVDWRRWRMPLALATVVLLVNIIGLNVDWMGMKREAEALRISMVQTYRSAFPNDPVIVDPLAQLRQKLSATQRGAGQLAPDDFLALVAAFAEAWTSVGQGPAPVASLEYRDGTLNVRLKPDSNVQVETMQGALASRNLSLVQGNDNVWQIRSGK